jgi:hypothetical protein
MHIDQAEIDRLVARPAETRDLEIKPWIDPRTPDGKAKLTWREALGLRYRAQPDLRALDHRVICQIVPLVSQKVWTVALV